VAPFTDVPIGNPFCGEITWLRDAMITTGYLDGTFRPNGAVDRQSMAAFLYRVEGRPRGSKPPCPAAPFGDVQPGQAFCGEIAWLADAGVAKGYADGGFHPNAPIARQATVAFLHRLDQLP